MRSRTWSLPAFLLALTSVTADAAAPPCTGTATSLVSIATNGTVGNNNSSQQDINEDGRYVAFRSAATDIVSYPVNRPLGSNVYRRDRSDNSVRVLDDNPPNQGFNDTADVFAISGDGQRIAFTTLASNVAAGVSDTNGDPDVYVKDFRTNGFLRASVPDSSITATQESQHGSNSFSINRDGRYVAFISSGLVFTSEYYAFPEPNVFNFHIYVRDTAANRTYLVTRGVNAQGQPAALNGTVGRPVLAASGQLLAFTTNSTNLRNYPNPTGKRDVYIAAYNGATWDVIEKIPSGPLGIDHVRRDDISISPDGRYVAYIDTEPNNTGELYVFDRQTSTTFRPRPGGARPTFTSANDPRLGNDTIVWRDYDINGEGNGGAFWLHIPTGTLQRIGRETNGAPACCGSNGTGGEPGTVGVSADGRWTTYHSGSPRITPPDGNGTYDVFVQRMTAVADFTFTCSSLTCSFDATPTLSACAVSSYAWTFGDSSTGSGATPTHSYATFGQRPVTLTVTDVNGAQSSITKLVTPMPDAITSSGFVPMQPCRLFDSRIPPNARIPSGQELMLSMLATPPGCGPNGAARAASITITAIAPDAQGYLSAYGTGSPSVTAAMNFAPATSPRANNVIVPVAKDGTFVLKPMLGAGAVDLVVDLHGYFTTASGFGITPLGFQTVTSCEVYDSRDNGGAPYNPGEVRNISLQGVCGIPTGAGAASLNATVAASTTAGHLTLYPAGSSLPPTSNLNYPTLGSDPLSNGARVLLAGSTPDLATKMSVYGGTAHLIVDTNGYFKQDAPLLYSPLTPCRALDTRLAVQGPSLRSGEARSFQIRGNCGVPADARAAMVNVTVIGPSASGQLIAYPSGTSAPPVSTLHFPAGEPALGNGTIVALSQSLANDLSLLATSATNGSRANVVIDIYGYFR